MSDRNTNLFMSPIVITSLPRSRHLPEKQIGRHPWGECLPIRFVRYESRGGIGAREAGGVFARADAFTLPETGRENIT